MTKWTTVMMSFHDLVAKAAAADFIRNAMGFSDKRLIELEAYATTGAAYGVKDHARQAQRNG